MALDSTDLQNNPALLSQLLALLQGSQQNGGTSPNALLPNQSQNQAGQIPEFSAPGTLTSLPTSGMSDAALRNWYNSNQGNTFYNSQGQLAGIPSESGGGANQGNSYGMAAPSSGGTPEPGTIRAMMNKGGILNGASLTNPQSDQFTQLLQGLVNKYQSSAPATAAAPVSAPPPPPPVANNQAAYTAPSQAQIPGMNLAQQVQAGTASPTAITAAGGPLTASSGSGLQFPGQYNPINSASPTLPAVSQMQATGSPLSGLSGLAQIPATAMQTYQRAQQLQNQGFGPSSRSYSPTPVNWDPNAQLTGSSYTPTPAGVSGYIGTPSGASADNGGMDGTSGFIGTGAGDDASAGAGAGASAIGGSVASGIQAVGDAIQKMYTPIKLKIPAIEPGLQNPTPPVFTSPQMIA